MIDLQLSKNIFNDVYFPYLYDYTHRYEVYYGGAGSGKSVFIAQKILVKCLASVRKVLVVRKTQVSQKESCWRLFLTILSQWNILTYCKVNKTDYTIDLPNGSVLLFKSLDDRERLKSIVGISDEWIEEATEISEEDFEQLDLRLRANVPNQQIFISFNPISKANWVYKRWFKYEQNASLKDKLFILKTTYKDNKFLPKEYISSLEDKINTNITYYRIYALGEFCSLDKLIFSNWKIKEFDNKDIKGQLLIGVDFGFANDPTAIISSVYEKETNTLYIFKEFTDTNKTNKEIANIIKDLGFSKSIIIADSAEPKSIEEIKREGINRIRPSVKGKDSVLYGIQKLQNFNIVVHPSCVNTITEFENYAWTKDKQTNEYTNQPIDMFNHCIDALRYSIQILDINKLTTMSKSTLGL